MIREDTHKLESRMEWTNQGGERKRASKTHSQAEERKGTESKSGHLNDVTEPGTLTS
jgi:hypothetical protein